MKFKELRERLVKLDTACVCDSKKDVRVVDPEIKPINQGSKLIGTARTVQSKDDFLTVIKALNDAQEDEVLVIDGQGTKFALTGELISAEAQRKKLGGIVIDGGCRDVNQIRKMDIPVYARFITPISGAAVEIFSTQIPITCGGAAVHPGDIIFGDDDGIVVLSMEEAVEILDSAEGIQRVEKKAWMKMKDNKSFMDMLNFAEHYEKISQKKESKLTLIA